MYLISILLLMIKILSGNKIKSKIEAKNAICKNFWKKKIFEFFFENLITKRNELISSTKALYYENLAKKLHNPFCKKKRISLF